MLVIDVLNGPFCWEEVWCWVAVQPLSERCRLQPLCLCSRGAECEHTPELWPSVHLSTEALNHPDPDSAVHSSEATQSTQDVHSPFVNTHSAISLADRECCGRAMCQHIYVCIYPYTVYRSSWNIHHYMQEGHCKRKFILVNISILWTQLDASQWIRLLLLVTWD